MDLHRINIKFYLEDSAALAPEKAASVFSNWIPQTSDEVLVDVADYSHVGNGPLTLLVGHDANYSLDNTDGRPGLFYARKQPLAGDLAARLAAAFRAALKACRRLEEEPELAGAVRFRGNEILLVANDRLQAPNNPSTLQALQPALDSLLGSTLR